MAARESLREFSIASRIIWFSSSKYVSDAFMDMLAVNWELFTFKEKTVLKTLLMLGSTFAVQQ